VRLFYVVIPLWYFLVDDCGAPRAGFSDPYDVSLSEGLFCHRASCPSLPAAAFHLFAHSLFPRFPPLSLLKLRFGWLLWGRWPRPILDSSLSFFFVLGDHPFPLKPSLFSQRCRRLSSVAL